ncbi:hypothetical protein [Burkholderia sp. IDO3]|uniref:hypothetical protein n=1 Tax=Burkholderia sp. IDO3 TaxID=1705310 RepID=UPI000BBA933C|nr:hypothetical protein [Burkholderia sp. IDO3]AXK68050.1 hypothetical protein DCN14_36090 [Burkholderia sp. IDO3]PCD57978.1 hypothetical protein CN645_31030 [Burkholderia sp. IDO3]
MLKKMQPISVEVDEDGLVVLTQQVNDLNEPDPRIELTVEQTPLVAQWLYEAAGDAAEEAEAATTDRIPIRYFARGPEAESETLEVFTNSQGMVVLRIDDDTFIEVAPAMAKRLREQLSLAIRASLAEMLRPDDEA